MTWRPRRLVSRLRRVRPLAASGLGEYLFPKKKSVDLAQPKQLGFNPMDSESHKTPDCRGAYPTICVRSRTAYACRPAASGLSAKFTASTLIITPHGDGI